MYVDDILITSVNPQDVKKVIEDLNTKFALKTLGPVSYFLGFEAARKSKRLVLTPTKYALDLQHKTNIAKAKPYTTPMVFGQKLALNDIVLLLKSVRFIKAQLELSGILQ